MDTPHRNKNPLPYASGFSEAETEGCSGDYPGIRERFDERRPAFKILAQIK